MLIGFEKVWIHKFIVKKKINKKKIDKIFNKIISILKKMEKYTKKRLNFMDGKIQNKVIAFTLFLIGITCLTPFPFINTLPGISVILISFGILNKDGVITILGYICSIFGFLVVISTFSLTLKLISKIFSFL